MHYFQQLNEANNVLTDKAIEYIAALPAHEFELGKLADAAYAQIFIDYPRGADGIEHLPDEIIDILESNSLYPVTPNNGSLSFSLGYSPTAHEAFCRCTCLNILGINVTPPSFATYVATVEA